MHVWPLKFREVKDGGLIITDDAGGFFRSSEAFLTRYISGKLTANDQKFLLRNGHAFLHERDINFIGFAARWSRRINRVKELDFVILIPTLRCDLACSYCQVSRANVNANGFDWSEEQLEAVLLWLGENAGPKLKVEFQGGECLLRIDLLERVRDYCRDRFEEVQFVVCTNLQNLSAEAWHFLSATDTVLSTSFDGTMIQHQRQRTKTPEATHRFEMNLLRAATELGPEKISALPTFDPVDLPEPADVIRSFVALGLRSIFLRRVNYQGFARKRYDFATTPNAWIDYYRQFVRAVVSHNAIVAEPVEEFYIAHLIRRIVQGGQHGHVNLRNPNWIAQDYIVIDFDGALYPSDEARMMTRVGQIDLSIGHVRTGFDENKIATLQTQVSNFDDPDCQHCAFQAYCGLDIIDDLSRYGRIDLPRPTTDHCQVHQGLFELAFELIYSADAATQHTVRSWLGVASLPADTTPRHS
ncbi:Radical SAM domain protein [Rhodobacter ferrooxidans]|uniref:Radical SAM domain protein n=2 Tax=Rhodobacter ferrooxidans TaxID=371731 RepID=C8S4M4_9RHOB|nr:Radical SAM domain protein [Rhodobacter sp. SW2]